MRLITPHSDILIKRLVPALFRGGEVFWNPTVNKMTYLTLKKLMASIINTQSRARANKVVGYERGKIFGSITHSNSSIV